MDNDYSDFFKVDHGVIGWIEEENGTPEMTCDDFDDCKGCPKMTNDGVCTM